MAQQVRGRIKGLLGRQGRSSLPPPSLGPGAKVLLITANPNRLLLSREACKPGWCFSLRPGPLELHLGPQSQCLYFSVLPSLTAQSLSECTLMSV